MTPAMLFADLPTAAEAAADRARAFERDNPERETLLLAAAGAAKVLGARHSATSAFAKASITMDRVDLWHARLRSGPCGPPVRFSGWVGRAHGRLCYTARQVGEVIGSRRMQ